MRFLALSFVTFVILKNHLIKGRFPLRDNLDNEIAFKVINARAVEILFYILQASYDDS